MRRAPRAQRPRRPALGLGLVFWQWHRAEDANRELRQTADTKDLIYDISRLIEFASAFYTLYPGDVYYTGTPHGVGPVKPGDVLRGKCDQIGEFEIKVRAHQT